MSNPLLLHRSHDCMQQKNQPHFTFFFFSLSLSLLLSELRRADISFNITNMVEHVRIVKQCLFLLMIEQLRGRGKAKGGRETTENSAVVLRLGGGGALSVFLSFLYPYASVFYRNYAWLSTCSYQTHILIYSFTLWKVTTTKKKVRQSFTTKKK